MENESSADFEPPYQEDWLPDRPRLHNDSLLFMLIRGYPRRHGWESCLLDPEEGHVSLSLQLRGVSERFRYEVLQGALRPWGGNLAGFVQ